MTEQEWLTATDPSEMFYSPVDASARKLQLLAVACCRRIPSSIVDERWRNLLAEAELHADGMATYNINPSTYEEISSAIDDGIKAHEAKLQNRTPNQPIVHLQPSVMAAAAVRHAVFVGEMSYDGVRSTVICSAEAEAAYCCDDGGQNEEERDESFRVVSAKQSMLVRHIMGNPFRPYQPPPSWPSTVTDLAQSLYDQEPVHFALHDALLDCGHQELAEHFTESYHPKGCWALDAILGKS